MADQRGLRISLHLRVWKNLPEVAREALALHRSFFQCFLISQNMRRTLLSTPEEAAEFLELRQNFAAVFAHAAYWVNLAVCEQKDSMSFLYKEAKMAQSLTFSHYVMHAGTALGCSDRLTGIDNVARRLNKLMRQVTDIKFVLENGAHANKAVGTQLHDFSLILNKLDYPEKILFCLDTAHAYVAGYDITKENGYEQMLHEVETTIGLGRLALIHLNDTSELLGSHHDRHEVPGRGKIGEAPLKKIVQDPRLAHVPCIVEMPPKTEEEERQILSLVESWLT